MWWQLHKGMKDWPGLRLSHDCRACQEYGINRTQVDNPSNDRLETERHARLGAGGNSGFQAINLAVQFGATKIMLIGIDCGVQGDISRSPHWHGRHPSPLSNPLQSNFNRWKKAIDGIAGQLKSLGVDVVNCSPPSMLAAYPKMSVPEALERFA